VRREKYQTIVDPISQSNIRRLYDQDPEKALETDDFLKLLKSMEDNVEAQREFLRSPNALKYDFTQHYKNARPQPKMNGEEKNPAVQVNAVAEVGTA
jgi:hypothetical protein